MHAAMKRLRSTASTVQKVFIFGTVLFFIGGIFLHNPLGGYSPISKEVSTILPCSKAERLAQREKLLTSIRKSDYQFGGTSPWKSAEEWVDFQGPYCRVPGIQTVFLPFDDWRSDSPVVWWFGYVQNLFTYLVAILLIGSAGAFVFKSGKEKLAEQE